MPKAGCIYRSRRGHHVRIEQVRRSGDGGLSYALARLCGPRGRTHEHPTLKDKPLTIFLLPDGSMPDGYTAVKETP